MRRIREPLAFLLTGVGLIALSRLGGVASNDGASGNALAWQQLGFIYGVAAVVFAAMSYVLVNLGTSLLGCVRDSWLRRGEGPSGENPAARRISFEETLWLLAALLVGFWLRWVHIRQPMRLDESYSFMTFVNSHWTNVFLYPFPNNHVLNSIFERLSCALFGTDEPGIRAPAMFFGLLMIPLAFMLSRRMAGTGSGWLAAVAVAVWPYLVLFSTNGRGYTLLCLLTMLAAYVLVTDEGRIRSSQVVAAANICALGMLTMPSMLFAVAGLLLWMATLSWVEERDVALVVTDTLSPFAAVFLGLTLLFYTPVALVSGGLQGVMANKEARALPLEDFLHQAVPHLETSAGALGFAVPGWLMVVFAAAGAWGVVDAWRRGRIAGALLWPCMLGGALLLFAIKRSIPFPRTWIFLIPFMLMAADQGLTQLTARIPALGRWMIGTAVMVGALIFGRHLVVSNAVQEYPETGVAPAAELAQGLSTILTYQDYVCSMVPTNVVLSYELWRAIKPADDAGAARIYWVRRPLTGPSRGKLDGWQTVVDAGQMVAAVWTLATHPPLAAEPGMDCWQPVKRKFEPLP